MYFSHTKIRVLYPSPLTRLETSTLHAELEIPLPYLTTRIHLPAVVQESVLK